MGIGGVSALLCILSCLITVIVVLASIKTLGPEDQMVIHYLDGKDTVDGPTTKVFNPFREREVRQATRVGPTEFVVINNQLDGSRRAELGPKLVFLKAYDEIVDSIRSKTVLKKDQYIRFYDKLTGNERVERGPSTVVPNVWEVSPAGVQQAAFINRDSAALVLNKESGEYKLVAPVGEIGERVVTTSDGVYFPDPYEEVTEIRRLIRVAPHETMVMRSSRGLYLFKSGADGDGTGTSFFLPPYCEIVQNVWSAFSNPRGFGEQEITRENVERIDLRSRKVFFQYEVRTNDNVNLRVKGTIYWRVADVNLMVSVTADPAGDVWHHARSALIGAVSNSTLDQFTNGFNVIVQRAFQIQKTDGFYTVRGLDVDAMEVIEYECVDAEVAATLFLTSQASVNRLNALQVQQSVNDVAHAKMDADIVMEGTKTSLIIRQAANERLMGLKAGEADGTKLANSASAFIDGLEASVSDVNERVGLYKLHRRMMNQNQKTEVLASGGATLFLSPEDVSFNLSYSTEL